MPACHGHGFGSSSVQMQTLDPILQELRQTGTIQYTNISSEIYVDHKRYMEEYSIYTMIYLLLHHYLPLTAKVFDLVSTSVNEKSIYCIVPLQ